MNAEDGNPVGILRERERGRRTNFYRMPLHRPPEYTKGHGNGNPLDHPAKLIRHAPSEASFVYYSLLYIQLSRKALSSQY